MGKHTTTSPYFFLLNNHHQNTIYLLYIQKTSLYFRDANVMYWTDS